MRKYDPDEDREFFDFLNSLTDEERMQYFKNEDGVPDISDEEYMELVNQGAFMPVFENPEDDPTIIEIDEPIEEFIRKHNLHCLDEWLDRMSSI